LRIKTIFAAMKTEKQIAAAAAAFAERFKLYQGMNACPTHARGQKKRNYMKKGEIELRKCSNDALKESNGNLKSSLKNK